MQVSGREAQQAKAGIHQQVLAAIVLDQTLAMVDAVVLDHESRLRVVEVCTTDESTRGVV